jgi:glycosyltransferase involved in cell wall biosynthesis
MNSVESNLIKQPQLEILFVIGSLQVGGAERHVVSVANSLHRLGRSVAVYSASGDGPLRPELEQGGVTVLFPALKRRHGQISVYMRSLYLLVTVTHLLGVMLRRKPPIVHFFLPEAYVVGAPLAVLARRPLRIMSRRSLNVYQTRRPLLRSLELPLHRWMTAFLGNSRSVVRQLEGEGIASERVGLIYNGIDLVRVVPKINRSAMRVHLGFTQNTLVMTVVANLIPYKGHDDLFRALASRLQELPSTWQLLVVGRDDGIGASLEKEADVLGIAGHVSFLGARDDVADILGASDIGILCSHEEGFSNAVLEGMAASLPMVVTDVGGNSEAVVHEECGLVVPPGDIQRLGEAIVTLARDAPRRMSLGQAARHRIETEFTLEKCVDRYNAFYSELLAGILPKDIVAIHPQIL